MYKRIVMKDLHLKDVNPRVCGMRDCEPGFTVGPNIRDHWIVHYVFAGKGVFVSNGHRYELQTGDLFVVHPGDICTYLADEQDPWSYIWAAFDLSSPPAALLEAPVLHAAWAATLFSRIAACDQSSAPEWTLCALVHEFLAALAQQGGAAGRASSADYITRALNDIHSNYDQPLRIADLASSLGLDRHYFCRLFHQHTGMSPQAYLVAYRLNKASELLSVHHLPQKEAARLVGYSDVSAFAKMFKRTYGIAPGALQRAGESSAESDGFSLQFEQKSDMIKLL